MDESLPEIAFTAAAIEWRGPAPFHFVPVPMAHAGALRDAARIASYGWGVIPVEASIDGIDFRTSLFPRDGGYLLPLKAAVRRDAGLVPGDVVAVRMRVRRPIAGR